METALSHPWRRGGAVRTLIMVLVVLALVGLLVVGVVASGYNRAISLDENTQRAWADIDAQLQRRYDLIPNLVETVRGYATHERELFTHIADARTRYFQADTRGEQMQAANQLEGFLSRLLVLREAYPELRANENFLALQDQLEGTENRIAVARTRYNAAVTELNTYCRSFFGRFFANMAGVGPAERFEVSAEEARAAPQVQFN